jgi:hypothetical protein
VNILSDTVTIAALYDSAPSSSLYGHWQAAAMQIVTGKTP